MPLDKEKTRAEERTTVWRRTRFPDRGTLIHRAGKKQPTLHLIRTPDRSVETQPVSASRGRFERLRERKMAEWTIAYLAIAWMALQITDALREIWAWPVGLQRGITLALGLGLFPAVVLAWYHGEKGRQRICPLEFCVLGSLVVGSIWLIRYLCS